MNSQRIRCFLAVARTSSFRQAGEALHIAASAVNRQISLLEEELGVPLFERGRGRSRLRLSAAGEILLVHARAATAEMDRGRAQIEALSGLKGGSVTVGVPETLARDFLPEFLAEINASMPRIAFNVCVESSPRLITMLLADQLDVALTFNAPPQAGLLVAASLERPTYLMMTADHPLAGRASVRLSDYAQYPAVVPAENTSMWAYYERIFDRLAAKPPIALVSNSYEMLRSAARVGIGTAIVNDYLVARGDKGGPGVAFVPISDPLIGPQLLSCCVHKGRKLPVAAAMFVERVKEALLRLRQ